MKNKLVLLIILFLIVGSGFFFRLKGIQSNHSFWSDEADISSYARELITGETDIFQVIQSTYQPLENLLVAISFKVFGVSEWSARLPTVIFSSLGIIFAYLLAAKLSNYAGGLLAAFLFAFSQLNLAHATQVKPYAIIETSILAVLYFMLTLSHAKNHILKFKLHSLIIIILSLTSFLHPEGFLSWIIYIIFIFCHFRSRLMVIFKKPILLFLIISFLTAVSIGLKLPSLIAVFFLPEDFNNFSLINNTTYLRELFWKNYAFITLPAIAGILITFQKHKVLTTGLVVWSALLIFIWDFRAFHNIRYLMPVFGIILVYFAVFWALVGEKFMIKKSWLICLLVAVLLYAGGNKISRKPQTFYNPNSDLLADIQIADYKTAYSKLKEKFPNYQKMAIFNNFLDPQRWYLGTHPTVYFMKGTIDKRPHGIDKRPIYGNLNGFLQEKQNYAQGLLIVEDWQSILPDDIKEYAKKNLKREIRVEGLPQAKGDNWPIEVYSWGL